MSFGIPVRNGLGIGLRASTSLSTRGGSGGATLYVEDVFSTYLYTGNGSTQTITNGIDLAGKGGLVWMKTRGANGQSHNLYDTVRGATNLIYANFTIASQVNATGLTSFNSTGFSLGSSSQTNFNNDNMASWTFREAPKFFDVVTYTGNGATTRDIAHSLGVAPGMVIVKATSTTDYWWCWHRAFAADEAIFLNTTGAKGTYANSFPSVPTATNFTVGSGGGNTNGVTYVAYLYAHDTASDGIIQCGSSVIGAGGNSTVTLGWEPQWILIKRANAAQDWYVIDNMRGFTVFGQNDEILEPNTSDAAAQTQAASPTATGFTLDGWTSGDTWIYMAIRRGPMKTPTLGTSVFSPTTYAGTGATGNIITLGVTPDLMIGTNLSGGNGNTVFDRLRGNGQSLIYTNNTDAETTNTTSYPLFDVMNGYRNRATGALFNGIGFDYIRWAFRRAPGFMDEVCYTGNGVNGRTINHNLGVTPELMIMKNRSSTGYNWFTWDKSADLSQASALLALSNAAGRPAFSSGNLNSTVPTSTVFTIGGDSNVSGQNYVTYLFASCPGVSKVGSYTGNGSSQTINCAFAAGARFVMIKRTDSTGDWYVWDSARGIVAGNDPYLALNSTAAEVTTNDSVDTDNTGFIVNQVAASNVNVNAATYIFLAVA